MDNIKTWTGLSVEESIRMTEDRDKWSKYVHGVANPRIEDGYRTEQNNKQRKRRFLANSVHIKIACEQVCVQLPTSAVNVALPAFTAERRAAAAPAVQRWIPPTRRAHSSKPATGCFSGRIGQAGHRTVA